jgi:3-dehydroquinate dehydratase-2
MRRVLLINGPNLNLLGTREPGLYGKTTLPEAVETVRRQAAGLGVELEAVQSNDEGELVGRIQSAAGRFDGIILNPGAYTHTSIAIRDAIQGVALPCVEVHLSNIHAREDFRQRSLTAPACIGVLAGFGTRGYGLALEGLLACLDDRKGKTSI